MAKDTGYFVYFLFNEEGRPIYVGMGGRDCRPYEHIRDAKKLSRSKKFTAIRKTLSSLGEVPIVITRSEMTLAEARLTEQALIEAIGRCSDGGSLLNIANSGGPYSVEHLISISKASIKNWERWDRSQPRGMAGRKHSAETIQKMREAAAGRAMDAAVAASVVNRRGKEQPLSVVQKRTAAQKARWAVTPKRPSSQESIQCMAETKRGVALSSEHKLKLRIRAKEQWARQKALAHG